MADISAEVAAFRDAAYGEEVRGSMISLANKLNDETTAGINAINDAVDVVNGYDNRLTNVETSESETSVQTKTNTIFSKGFTLLDNSSTNEKKIYNYIIASYVDGSISEFENLRVGIFANTNQYKKTISLYDNSGVQKKSTYDTLSGYNVFTINNSKLYVLINWDEVESEILINTSTYTNLHIEYSSIYTILNTSHNALMRRIQPIENTLNSVAQKGFKLLNNASTNEKKIYNYIKISYVDGSISEFENLRVGIFANTNQYKKTISLYDNSGVQKKSTYDTLSGYNVFTINNSKLYVLINWDEVESEILINTSTYTNLHIEYNGAHTILDEIHARTYVKNAIDIYSQRIAYGFASFSSSTNAYRYVQAPASNKYGFLEYEVHEGCVYNIIASDITVYAQSRAAAIMILPVQLTENEQSISENNVIYTGPFDGTNYFPIVSYNKTITAPYDGYLYLYRQSSNDDEKIKVNQKTNIIDSVDNYCIYLRDLIKQIDVSKTSSVPHIPNIVCSGSSITWGNGNLDDSMVGYIDYHIRERLCETVMCDEMQTNNGTIITNNMFYREKGILITGVNEEVEFDLYGDEIAICHAKRRSTDYGIIEVYADGVLIGTFDNHNEIFSNEETFTGESLRQVELSHPCTFNHQIYINGSSTPLDNVVINSGGYGTIATGDAFVYRKTADDGLTTHHAIQFAESLGVITSVRVSYNYGRMINYTRNTQGQTNSEYTNESTYGSGTVSFDPANPSGGFSSGLEFRAVDDRAFFIHKFNTIKNRHYKLKIKDGLNPYVLLNFATNRYFNIMNAGIGGWTISLVGHTNTGIGKYTQFGKYSIPEIIFQESETNDDWSNSIRRISRDIGELTLNDVRKLKSLEVSSIVYNSSTDKYRVHMATGIISSITATSLISTDIIGTNTEVGDIVRIGTYHGDIRQIICREITNVNLSTGMIEWKEPINTNSLMNVDNLSDLIGKEICIRNLNSYKALYKEFIENVRHIWGNTKIFIVDNGLPNLWTRQLWGYDIIHRKLCSEYSNVNYINAREYLVRGMDESITGIKYETITSTGVSEYELSYDYDRHAYWQGIKVLIDGIDVYGNDAYVEGTYSYYLKDSLTGTSCNKNGVYATSNSELKKNGKMKLVFTRNIPTAGKTIVVQFSDSLWSNDYCHPTKTYGAYLYGQAYNSVI